MKTHPTLSEKWLQQRIVEDTSLLGLGDLDVRAVEKSHPGAGRLDLLLYDAESNTRYEVELQLGATDESHIIRTLEYWDIERRRFPQYEHVAVIVAEDITSRFFNVISLFNGFIPVVAVQVSALEVNGALTLVFTKVLDTSLMAVPDDSDSPVEPKDRPYWEAKASPVTMAICDRLLELVREVEPSATLNYNKSYVGLAVNGVASNFIVMHPRKHLVRTEIKIPNEDLLTRRMEDAGVTVLGFQARWGVYRVQLTDADFDQRADLLRELVKLAHANRGTRPRSVGRGQTE